MTEQLEEGKRYRVVSQIPGVWRVPRESVMTYIGRDEDTLQFSLRPLAGTQELDARWVITIEQTDDKLHLPRKVKA